MSRTWKDAERRRRVPKEVKVVDDYGRSERELVEEANRLLNSMYCDEVYSIHSDLPQDFEDYVDIDDDGSDGWV